MEKQLIVNTPNTSIIFEYFFFKNHKINKKKYCRRTISSHI